MCIRDRIRIKIIYCFFDFFQKLFCCGFSFFWIVFVFKKYFLDGNQWCLYFFIFRIFSKIILCGIYIFLLTFLLQKNMFVMPKKKKRKFKFRPKICLLFRRKTIGHFWTGIGSPVRIDSLTNTLPSRMTQSQGIWSACGLEWLQTSGISITSPGTRSFES